MEKNIRLFPLYKMFSYDILFYYAISAPFFLQTKSLTLSEFALLTTAYSISSIAAQIPAAVIADRLGLKRSMITGNILCLIWGLNLIISNSFINFVIGEFVLGCGFALKGVSESPFLLATLKKIKRSDEFAKIEAKGSTLYFLIEAIACVAAGWLYTMHEYLPIIFACVCSLVATLLSFNFEKIKSKGEKLPVKVYFSDLSSAFKYIFKSKRLNALMLFCCLFYGVISICNIFMKSTLSEYSLSATGFGVSYAIFSIFCALGSKIQGKLEKRHKNKTLTVFSLTYIILLIVLGIISLFNFNNSVLIKVALVVFSIQSIIKGAYRIIIKQYITRYTTNSIRSKLMSVYYLCEHLGSTILSAFSSLLLANFSVGMSCTIAGFVIIIALIFVLEFMSSKVGLKPEKYALYDRLDLQ